MVYHCYLLIKKGKKMNRKLLKFNDFSFGFELEGLLDKKFKKSRTELRKDLDSILNLGKGNMHNDGSLTVNKTHYTFEYSSPIIPFTPKNLMNFVKLLDSLPSLGVHTDKSCAFHIHFSHKNLTHTDAVWFLAYLAHNHQYLDILHSNINDYCFYNKCYADYKFLDDAYAAFNFVNNDDFLKIICDNEKYRNIRIHPQGTIDWRGPRTFLNINSHNKNIKFVKDLYKFISLMNDSRNCDILQDFAKKYPLYREDVEIYTEKEMKNNNFDFSSYNTDTFQVLRQKMEKNPLYINNITADSFKKYKKYLLDISNDNFFLKIIKKFAKTGVSFNNSRMFSQIISRSHEYILPLLKNMKLSFFKRYVNEIAKIGCLTYIYESLEKSHDNDKILNYLHNLAFDQFCNPKIRIFTLNVTSKAIRKNNELLLKIIDKDFKKLIDDEWWLEYFIKEMRLTKEFKEKNYSIINNSPNRNLLLK